MTMAAAMISAMISGLLGECGALCLFIPNAVCMLALAFVSICGDET